VYENVTESGGGSCPGCPEGIQKLSHGSCPVVGLVMVPKVPIPPPPWVLFALALPPRAPEPPRRGEEPPFALALVPAKTKGILAATKPKDEGEGEGPAVVWGEPKSPVSVAPAANLPVGTAGINSTTDAGGHVPGCRVASASFARVSRVCSALPVAPTTNSLAPEGASPRAPDPVAELAALASEIRLEVPRIGDVFLVAERGKGGPRREVTFEDMAVLRRVIDVFPGAVLTGWVDAPNESTVDHVVDASWED
jgi:hypothetical protein